MTIKYPSFRCIVAIADVFDTLSSKRPYKDALPLDESFVIVEECRNMYFDPDVVTAFLAVRDEIRAIREKSGEQTDIIVRGGKSTDGGPAKEESCGEEIC